ncbi:EcsC family protein [Paenibacillus mesophilus]|uniref:EcsC family protein n=1 Tax=Paenibacillus mesophilus TaxID=2582849 RepID=UPI00110F1209|nr:EcsC family protein [Paenibacillus mesophilus]TMV46902.1 EcsC family protein [Paenibacillus mesophilus]
MALNPDGTSAFEENTASLRELQRYAQETRRQLETELESIARWERDQKDLWFWEKLGRIPFMLLDKLTPQAIQKKIGQAIDELGGYVQTGGRYLVSEKSMLASLERTAKEAGYEGASVATVAQAGELPLAVMDRAADRLAESRKKIAAVQGATTGFGGLFTLAVDIPALLGLSLKVLQETAICYGFDPNDPRERVFIVKCLQFSSSDIVGKKAVLEELATYDGATDGKQLASQLQGWREVITTYRDNFGWKKLFQLVPVAGMLFGALLNKSTVNDVAEAGKMMYRKRRIIRRLGHLE